MTMKEFTAKHRPRILLTIRRSCNRDPEREDLAQWVENDQELYLLTRREGVISCQP